MPDDNVVELNTITTLEIPADRVLEAAIGEVRPVVVVGLDDNGDLYFATSEPKCPTVLWLLEKAKQQLLED